MLLKLRTDLRKVLVKVIGKALVRPRMKKGAPKNRSARGLPEASRKASQQTWERRKRRED